MLELAPGLGHCLRNLGPATTVVRRRSKINGNLVHLRSRRPAARPGHCGAADTGYPTPAPMSSSARRADHAGNAAKHTIVAGRRRLLRPVAAAITNLALVPDDVEQVHTMRQSLARAQVNARPLTVGMVTS